MDLLLNGINSRMIDENFDIYSSYSIRFCVKPSLHEISEHRDIFSMEILFDVNQSIHEKNDIHRRNS